VAANRLRAARQREVDEVNAYVHDDPLYLSMTT
jgi:hypothetical protein